MLYEKYRPTQLSDYVGNDKIIKELISWLEGYYNIDLNIFHSLEVEVD